MPCLYASQGHQTGHHGKRNAELYRTLVWFSPIFFIWLLQLKGNVWGKLLPPQKKIYTKFLTGWLKKHKDFLNQTDLNHEWIFKWFFKIIQKLNFKNIEIKATLLSDVVRAIHSHMHILVCKPSFKYLLVHLWTTLLQSRLKYLEWLQKKKDKDKEVLAGWPAAGTFGD